MLKNNFDKIVDRRNTSSLKWDNLKDEFPNVKDGVLPLWVADMDFEVAPCIVEALHKRVDHKIYGYSTDRNEEYLDSVLNWFKTRHNWEADRDAIFFSPGVIPALGYFINLLTEEGNGVIIQEPVYYPFSYLIRNNNRKLVNNELIYEDGKYSIDFELLEKQFADENNKLMIFCSPHNPVGRVWTKDELTKLVELAKKYDMWIISDEIHFDLTRKKVTHIVLETIDPSYKNKIITCTAPSKTFNLAGLQNSNIIINDKELVKKWKWFTKNVAHLDGRNTFGQVATQAAYEFGAEWLDECRDYIDENCNYIKSYIEKNMPKAKYIDCQGTYLVWIDLKEYNLDNDLDRIMTEEANVLLDGGTAFGQSGLGFQRINVACPRKYIEDAMDLIRNALEKHSS